MTKTTFALFAAGGTAMLALGGSCVFGVPAQATTARTTTAQAATTARTPSRTFDLAVGNNGVVRTDVGAAGLSVGDEFVYSDKLFRDGKQIGEDGSSCQVTRLEGGNPTTNCVLSVQLPDGQLTAQSLWTEGSHTARMAVTGGTGAYRGATGELTCNDIQTPHETYHVVLDR
ncbi:allene oxide cyclase barrel-like domain-containing protein [Streptomyces hundungensis]|uniref:allene oxide cyclase barrel-like domain-containing protein n=1 Tax=Streptomyces hundungensis TaxID=1077946 RepID=UPI0031F02687